MDWNDETIAQLRKLWAEGLSTAKIGAIMGISKNAVVGKAHRLQLPSRPSPIKSAAAGGAPARAATPKRVAAPVTAPMASPAVPAVRPAAQTVAPVAAIRPAAAPAPVAAAPAPVKSIAPAPRPTPMRVVSTPARPRQGAACCWPLGEPGTPQFRFCDAVAVQGRPYCLEHVQIAYVRIRDRRDDVA